MTVRRTLMVLALLACCGICHGKEERWQNFAEDADIKYYLDPQSVHSLPDNVFLFWIKSVAKDKGYYKREYNLSNLSYIFTNYELDCAVSNYRVRGSIMYDKNRRELSKSLPSGGEPVFEPVPPESIMELAQQEICVKKEDGDEEGEEDVTAASAQPIVPAPAAPPPSLTADFTAPEEPVAEPSTAHQPEKAISAETVEPVGPAVAVEPVAPAGTAVSVDPETPVGPAVSVDSAAPMGPAVSVDRIVPIGPAVSDKPAASVGPAASVHPIAPEHLSPPLTKGS